MRMPGFDRVIESCRLRLHVVKLVPIHAALRNSAPVSTHVLTMQFMIYVIFLSPDLNRKSSVETLNSFR